MCGSRMFCQRGSNFDDFLFFLEWSKYHYKRSIIGPQAKRHFKSYIYSAFQQLSFIQSFSTAQDQYNKTKKEHFLWHFVHTGNSQTCHRLRAAYFILFSWKITTILKNCRNLVGGNKSFQLFFSTNLSIKFIRIEFHNNLSVIISQWEELILYYHSNCVRLVPLVDKAPLPLRI